MSIAISPKPSADMRQNFIHLYFDVLWYGVLAGSTVAFLAIYAARLEATSFELGLLAAVPAVINLIFSLPAGHWLEKQPLIRSTFWSSFGQRILYLLLVPLPWLFGNTQQIWAIIAITLLMSAPGTLLAIAFNALFADSVPPEWRAQVVGRRNAIIALSTTISALVSGQLLDYFKFPSGYQIVFLIGAVGALMSSYHLSRICSSAEKPIRVGRPLGDFAFPGLVRLVGNFREAAGLRFLARSEGRPLLRIDLLRGPFGVFMGAYLIFYIFQNLPLPLFPIYMVNNLHLSDGAISLGNGLFYTTMMAVSLYSVRLNTRLGHRNNLILGALMFGGYPLILYLAWDASLYWLASVYGGAVWAILNGGLVNRLMERVPEDDRPAHMAIHNLALNTGILIGSMMAPVFANWVGVREALLWGSLLRGAAGVLLWVWG